MIKISIIIPKTPKEDIKECLDSIKESTYKNYEVIVVDEGYERSKQRNIGIMRAKGDYLLFLDADQFISKTLLGEAVKLFSIGYDALYIPEIIVTAGWFGNLRNWERQFYNATEIDCVRFVKAENCPRFDETMNGPEDSDFDKTVGGIRRITSSPFYHRDNVTLIRYMQKKAYYSRSMKRYAAKWPNAKVLDLKWRCFGVFLEYGKYKELLKHPIKTIEVYLLIFVRGLIYLCNR